MAQTFWRYESTLFEKEGKNDYISYLMLLLKESQPRRQYIKVASVIAILVLLLVSFIVIEAIIVETTDTTDIYVGLNIGYGDEQTAIKQIDKVASYVNLIILGSLNVTMDTEALSRVCDHIYQKGLHFIVYVAFGESENAPPRGPDAGFFVEATRKYSDKFLGVYIFDEVGGKLVDGAHSINVDAADMYSEASILYTRHLRYFLGNVSDYYGPAQFPIYTSDYALYWYDYLAGYDVVFTEYVGNQSRQIATGLCRGAAKSFDKEWGVIITWSNQPNFFVENPEQLYRDMVLAYQNGAQYIIVFNSPGQFDPPTEYGTLTSKHFEKMEQFWNYVQDEPPVGPYPANNAFVLPKDYGFGFRSPTDRIWGKWEADNLSQKIWEDTHMLLETYVLSLDIVYETKIGDTPIDLPYGDLFFWNGTILRKDVN